MSESSWQWKLIGLQPFGPVVAQIREVPGPGRHFLLRRICGIQPSTTTKGSFDVNEGLMPVMFLSDRTKPMVAYPNAVLWIRDLGDQNVAAMEKMYREVAIATPGDVKAEEQKRNRLTLLEGRNGG